MMIYDKEQKLCYIMSKFLDSFNLMGLIKLIDMPSGKKWPPTFAKLFEIYLKGVVGGTYIDCLSPYNEQGKQFEVTGLNIILSLINVYETLLN